MTVTTFLDQNEMPSPDDDQIPFDNKMAAVFRKLPQLGAEINATAASLNSIAAGGAYALPYTFSTTGATGTTTGGRIACDDIANQSATTYFAVDLKDAKGNAVAAQLAQSNASTSTVKGTARLIKVGDATKYIVLNITGWSTSTNYGVMAGTVVNSSSANPFTNGDSVLLFFQRAGDKGDMGSFPTLHLREERGSGTSSTAPANLSTGVYRRPLNVAKVNTITGASLGTDQFVLPAGTYRVRGDSLSVVSTGTGGQKYWHKMALYSVTDSAYLAIGLNGLSYDPTNTQAYVQMSPPVLTGSITLAAAKTIELRHLTPNANMASVPAAGSGQVEVYTDLIIEKTS